jgi:hypothetical protein
VRQREETLIADLDLQVVAMQRPHVDPTGDYNRPDIFRLVVDTTPLTAVVETDRADSKVSPTSSQERRHTTTA